jgi:hypothetical protein
VPSISIPNSSSIRIRIHKQPLLAVLVETTKEANDGSRPRPHLLEANNEGPVVGREQCQQEEGMRQPTPPHPTALPMSIITIIKWLWSWLLIQLAKSNNNMNNQTQ